MLRRRSRLIAILGIVFLVAFSVQAQQVRTIPRIGYLSLGAAAPPDVFVQRLRELGYSDKQNVVIEYRFGEGRHDVMNALARELIGLNVDVIMAFGDEALARLRQRAADAREIRPGAWSVFIPDADPYFRAERLLPRPRTALEPSFSILVVVDGAGRLETEHGGELPLARGDTVLVPYASGAASVSGELAAIRCLPPVL